MSVQTKWEALEFAIQDRLAWTEDAVLRLITEHRWEEGDQHAMWGRLEEEVMKYREWPTPRLADLMRRIEDDDSPGAAGQTEYINNGH